MCRRVEQDGIQTMSTTYRVYSEFICSRGVGLSYSWTRIVELEDYTREDSECVVTRLLAHYRDIEIPRFNVFLNRYNRHGLSGPIER